MDAKEYFNQSEELKNAYNEGYKDAIRDMLTKPEMLGKAVEELLKKNENG